MYSIPCIYIAYIPCIEYVRTFFPRSPSHVGQADLAAGAGPTLDEAMMGRAQLWPLVSW